MLIVIIPIMTYKLMIKAFSIDGEDDTEEQRPQVEISEKESEPEEEEKLEDVDTITFLVAGIDSYMEDKDTDNKMTGMRSDTLMLVKVNFINNKIDILSIPRDSRVPVRGKLDKINAAHSFGGTNLMLKTVNDFTGLDIEHYVKVDYKAVKAMVDAIGGIDINITEPMHYHDPAFKDEENPGRGLKIDFEPGIEHLDGQKAMEYLRYRSYKEGDIRRIQNQQYFMTEFIKQGKDKIGLTDIPSLVATYFKYVKTDFTMKDMIKLAKAGLHLELNNINLEKLPGHGETINRVSYYIIDENAKNEIINRMFRENIIEQNEGMEDVNTNSSTSDIR